MCKKHKVTSLYVFGSALTNKFKKGSNIDFLVSFLPITDHADYADNYFDLADALENLFNRSVDLVIEKSLSNPYFIKSVNQTKQLVYGK
ncbi:MAG: nucleotidyltransferase family protein [Marinirhabdus sp.]